MAFNVPTYGGYKDDDRSTGNRNRRGDVCVDLRYAAIVGRVPQTRAIHNSKRGLFSVYASNRALLGSCDRRMSASTGRLSTRQTRKGNRIMRTVVRNSFARHSITAERVSSQGRTCHYCGSVRDTRGQTWLYRFYVDPDSGRMGLIADGNLFCSRDCCESYTGRNFDETR